MPQFDYLIIFPLIKDLTIILCLFYIIFVHLIIKNTSVFKFRFKILNLKKSKVSITSLLELLFLKIISVS